MGKPIADASLTFYATSLTAMISALNNHQTVSDALSTRNRLRDSEIIRIP